MTSSRCEPVGASTHSCRSCHHRNRSPDRDERDWAGPSSRSGRRHLKTQQPPRKEAVKMLIPALGKAAYFTIETTAIIYAGVALAEDKRKGRQIIDAVIYGRPADRMLRRRSSQAHPTAGSRRR